MKLTHLAATAAAFALMGAGAALAQPPSDQSAPAGTQDDNAAPPANSSTDTSTAVNPPASVDTSASASTSAAPTGAAVSTSTTTNVGGATFTNITTTNGPVPDTPENRAKYGQPLSHAGKMTAAKGN
jgi:hypothetical protein